MKKLLYLIFILIGSISCSTQKNLLNNFPKTFKDSEIYVQNKFENVKINTNNYYMLISLKGDTTYVNEPSRLTMIH